MVNVEEALQTILSHTPVLKREEVRLCSSLGRTLARDMVAGENLPPHDNSSMDGYALASSALREVSVTHPAFLSVVGEARAGKPFRPRIRTDQAVRVMTGGVVPAGADAVVPTELVTIVDSRSIMLSQPVEAGQHIRRAGEDIVRGEVVLRAGQVLGPPHLGILASLGWKKAPVYKVPTVHILATGDELVPIGALPAEGQIRNSTSVMLEAYVSEAGAEPTALGIATDDKRKLRKKIQEGLNAHVLLITGGVSVGAYDFVGAVLAEIGVDVKFWKVNVKPGKPLLFGVLDDTLVFGLPGNPVSTCITFLRFVRPALYKMMGRVFGTALCFRAIIDHDIHKGDTRRQYLRGVVHQTDKELHVRTTGSQSSGVLSSMAKANCLIMLPEDTRAVRAGEWVDIELL